MCVLGPTAQPHFGTERFHVNQGGAHRRDHKNSESRYSPTGSTESSSEFLNIYLKVYLVWLFVVVLLFHQGCGSALIVCGSEGTIPYLGLGAHITPPHLFIYLFFLKIRGGSFRFFLILASAGLYGALTKPLS